MTKLKNSNCDKTQKLKFWQNSKTQIVTKLKKHFFNKIQKLKLWQYSKTQIVTKLKNSNCDKTQFMKKKTTLKGPFSKNNLTPWQRMRCTLGSVLRSCNVYACLCGKNFIRKFCVRKRIHFKKVWFQLTRVNLSLDKSPLLKAQI